MNLKVGLNTSAVPHESRGALAPARWIAVIKWLSVVCCLCWLGTCELRAATVPAGFTEAVVAGPWSDVVGTAFENNGRMYVWERTGKVWFKDPGDVSYTMLLDISEEVGAWVDYGMLGFVLDPEFRVNGYIYLLYAVDRYYLLNFGMPGYDPNANQYNDATIGRLTRYTCRASDGFRSVDPASRLILIGETKQTGFPLCSDTHGVGSLVFGQDGTLLISCGDGASAWAADTGGVQTLSYAPQALADGIIAPKEDIGAFRAQLVDCLNGKVIRIDPATGNGLPSNPYYNAANPKSARSRVWVLGLRNPCRMTLKPNTGSHNPADGDPGVLYIGDVGWNTWESLKVVTGPRQNFGWPTYEGLALTPTYSGQTYDVDVANQDAPNPLYPGGGCSQYFSFRQLLHEDTLAAAGQPPFNNPCNSGQKIPSSIPQFLHTRPVLDWNHSSAITRTPTYGGSGQAQMANVGANGSPVSGTQFQGNCAIGGAWYTGTNFPAAYQNRYYLADWGQGLIKSLTFDASDKPVALGGFASGAGAVVSVVAHPTDGSLYYVGYNYSGAEMRQITYTGNRTPVAVATADQYYGPTPVAVQLNSSGSGDPDGQPITYSWNFGDGSPVSTQANPAHSFSAPAGVPTKYVVTLTVTDSGGLSAQKILIVSVNNTPPTVAITSPVNGALFSSSNATSVNLTATVSDIESSDSQLLYQWQVLFHHNDHDHGNPADTNHATTAVIEPTGCDGINIYYYRILLTVTDPAGLATTREVRLYPDCGPNTPPGISDIADQVSNQAVTIPFTIGDAETPAANLQLSGASSNPGLVPAANIAFGGSGSNRTVSVTPVAIQTGTATITVTVNDGPHDVSDTFDLTVNSAPGGSLSFTNTTGITIPDSGTATPYPSTINVSGLGGVISNVTVTLSSLTHTYKADVDMLLVSPGGQKVKVMSDVGDLYAPGAVTLTLSDAAAAFLPQTTAISSGTYKPTDYSTGAADTFAAPAPAGPYGTNMAGFNGQSANGAWSLYIVDDGAGDFGSLAGGWSLTVTTVGAPQTPVITWTNPAAITYGTALSGVQLNATANVPGTFAYSPAAGTVLNASNAQNLSVTFTPTDTQNYTLAMKTVFMNVQKAPLSVVANNATRVYGQADPVLTATLTGLQSGDGITASNFCPATIDSPMGSYPIVPALIDPGSKLVNYSVTVTNGLLTILDVPRLLGVSESQAGTFVIECQVYAGRTYRFQYKDSILDLNWTDLGADQTAVSSSLAITNNAVEMVQRFYRLLDITDP